MEVYPATPTPEFPFEIEAKLKVLVTEFDTGVEFRRRKWRFPRRRVKLTYRYLSSEERNTLYRFIRDRSISYEPFYWFDWLTRSWIDEFVGYGDGSTTTFTLPGKEIDQSSLKVYLAGTETTDYSFSSGTGPNGEDQITFTSAPSNSVLITSDFSGKLRLKVRVSDETIAFLQRIPKYESFEVELIELR